MSDRNFFAELKRRNVVRMAGLAVVGWRLSRFILNQSNQLR